jgi:hypothetical protein
MPKMPNPDRRKKYSWVITANAAMADITRALFPGSHQQIMRQLIPWKMFIILPQTLKLPIVQRHLENRLQRLFCPGQHQIILIMQVILIHACLSWCMAAYAAIICASCFSLSG